MNARLPTSSTLENIEASVAAKEAEEYISPFCEGFSTCPVDENLMGMVFALKQIKGLEYTVLEVPKNQKAEDHFRATNAPALEMIANRIFINKWREKTAWKEANAAYTAMFKGWEEYKLYFKNSWEFISSNYKKHMSDEEESTEQEDNKFQRFYEKIKEEFLNAINMDVDAFIRAHKDDEDEKKENESEEKKIERLKKSSMAYLKAEARDLLAMMRKISEQDPSKPKFKTCLFYPTDGNHMSTVLRKYAWAFGYLAETFKIEKIHYRKRVGFIANGKYTLDLDPSDKNFNLSLKNTPVENFHPHSAPASSGEHFNLSLRTTSVEDLHSHSAPTSRDVTPLRKKSRSISSDTFSQQLEISNSPREKELPTSTLPRNIKKEGRQKLSKQKNNSSKKYSPEEFIGIRALVSSEVGVLYWEHLRDIGLDPTEAQVKTLEIVKQTMGSGSVSKMNEDAPTCADSEDTLSTSDTQQNSARSSTNKIFNSLAPTVERRRSVDDGSPNHLFSHLPEKGWGDKKDRRHSASSIFSDHSSNDNVRNDNVTFNSRIKYNPEAEKLCLDGEKGRVSALRK